MSALSGGALEYLLVRGDLGARDELLGERRGGREVAGELALGCTVVKRLRERVGERPLGREHVAFGATVPCPAEGDEDLVQRRV